MYFKIPFEYENIYAADVLISYSDNLEFKDAKCGVAGEKAVYTENKNVRVGFLPEEQISEITFCFKAIKKGEANIELKEITLISEDLTEETVKPEIETVFDIKTNAPTHGGGGDGGGSKGNGGTGGGSSSVFIPPKQDVPPMKIEKEFPFEDISSDYWARIYIADLYDKKIIAKDELFRPEEFVTRAEFTKLAVSSFGITSDDETCSFSDVSESDWFYTYVAAAADNGIICGDNGKFNPYDNITREDICVILYRIMKNISESTKNDFADMDKVSDYAYEAVSKLAGISVINGNEYGEFQPKEFATRAQAVKMISTALEKNN